MKSLAVAALCLFVSIAAQAATIAVGTPLPALTVAEKGELVKKGDDFSFQSWSSASLPGKVVVVQYLAARMAASKMNEPFTDALRAANFSDEKYLSTTLINSDDAMWGTGGMVDGELKSSLKKYPHASLVNDAKGAGLKAWGLKKEGSAIAVVDKTGKVIFFKEGALTADEIKSTLTLIQSNF
jgi:YtfJ family uncharacterized protein